MVTVFIAAAASVTWFTSMLHDPMDEIHRLDAATLPRPWLQRDELYENVLFRLITVSGSPRYGVLCHSYVSDAEASRKCPAKRDAARAHS
jgi:hypothetical protein